MPDPQSINGSCANFLPLNSIPSKNECALRDYLSLTQEFFWTATEHSNVGLDDIHAAAGLDRAQCANKILFLYPRFEPRATKTSEEEREMQFVSLALSEVRMYQPCALVVELSRMPEGKGHKVKVMHNEHCFSHKEVEIIAEQQIRLLVEAMCRADGDAFLGDIGGYRE